MNTCHLLSCYHLYYLFDTKKSIVKQTLITNKIQKKYYVIIKVRCSNGVAAPSHPTYGYIKNKLPVKIK